MKKKLLIGGIIGGVTLLAATPVALTMTGVVDIPVINKIVSNDAKKVNNKKKDNTDKTEDKKDNQNNTDSSSDTNDLDLYKKVIVKEEEKFDESKCKEIKFEKQERKPVSDDHNLKTSTYEDFLASYVTAIDQWNFYALLDLSFVQYSGFSGNQDFFDEMDGYVVSAKVLRDEPNEKLLKLKLDITKPGKSSLSTGINEKYVYFINVDGKWYASPLFNKLGDIERSITFKKSDSTIIARWPDAINAGYGFKDIDDYYKNGIHFSRKTEFDFNKDGKKDTITVGKPKSQLDYEKGINLWAKDDIFHLKE
ncbi:MAG: hypothetical protein K6G26_00350, partial [Lachnospiraceae bacterium]|nr:hypothetical protein [Lachnospiraceae bacterium]